MLAFNGKFVRDRAEVSSCCLILLNNQRSADVVLVTKLTDEAQGSAFTDVEQHHVKLKMCLAKVNLEADLRQLDV